MAICNYCRGVYSNQSAVTKHLDHCRVFKFEKEKFYKMQEIEKIKEINKAKEQIIINNYNNCGNTINNTINIQMNVWKEEVNKSFLNFEQEVTKILNEPNNRKKLSTLSIEDIKEDMTKLLKYLKNNNKITENFCNCIIGKNFELEIVDPKEEECLEYIMNKENVSSKNLTNQLKLITGKHLSDDIFKELNID